MPNRKGRPVGIKISLRERLIVWFALNPDEQLMLRDIAAKFDCTWEAAYWAAGTMVDAGLVERTGGRGQTVISIGPELARMIGRPVDSPRAAQP